MAIGKAGSIRITGGHLRGRKLRVLRGVRPAKDQVRQAVFSAMGSVVEGARVLDLFCGTGAYGLEALSRGAGSLLSVDEDAGVVRALQGVVREFGVDGEVQVQRGEVGGFVRSYRGAAFDFVFVDPPYEDAGGFVETFFSFLAERGVVGAGSVVIVESSARGVLEWGALWDCFWERRYGLSLISMLRLGVESREG